MIKTIDNKTLIITNAVLLIAVLALGWSAFFRGDNAYKERIKSLEEKNVQLQKDRDKIDSEIQRRNDDFDSLEIVDSFIQARLAISEEETARLRQQVDRAQNELSTARQSVIEARRRIEDLKKSPPNRQGEDLINSLKIKTQ
jgi:chromosome segregation ATPase